MLDIQQVLRHIWILPRRLGLEVYEAAATLPMLRGVWGAALHDLDGEAYRAVFHPAEARDDQPPRYLLRPVAEDRTAVDWTLIGRAAIRLDPQLLLAWGMAMQRGLGKAREPFFIRRICGLQPDGTVTSRPRPWRLSAAAWPLPGDPATTPCRLEFCTPLSLLRQGALIRTPTLKDLMVRGGWRVESLLPKTQRAAWRELRGRAIELAAEIPAGTWQGRQFAVARYSGRQDQEFTVPGVCGGLELPEGPGELWPLLAALQWIHVGKSTVVGLGQLTIGPAGRPGGKVGRGAGG